MIRETKQEKKNKRLAMAVSVGFHALLFVLLLFAVAWRAPNPPYPEYGIQLNFGVDDRGSGEVQPESTVSPQPREEQESSSKEVKPQEEQVQTKTEEKEPEIEPVPSKLESPVETKTEVKKEEKTAEKEPVKKESLPSATYEKKDNQAAKAPSQGDDLNKTGDKGDDKGTLDAKALYGKQGGGQGGSNLDLDGWAWDEIPRPRVPDNETGQIVFEIRVDDQGTIMGYKTITRGVSMDAEKACREAIEKLTFSKKPGAIVPAVSTGRITFVITAR